MDCFDDFSLQYLSKFKQKDIKGKNQGTRVERESEKEK
jgi:hypothetical protein